MGDSAVTHPYREVKATSERLSVKVDGVHVEADSDFLGPFEVHYDGSGTAAGVRIYADGVRVSQTVLAEPGHRRWR